MGWCTEIIGEGKGYDLSLKKQGREGGKKESFGIPIPRYLEDGGGGVKGKLPQNARRVLKDKHAIRSNEEEKDDDLLTIGHQT